MKNSRKFRLFLFNSINHALFELRNHRDQEAFFNSLLTLRHCGKYSASCYCVLSISFRNFSLLVERAILPLEVLRIHLGPTTLTCRNAMAEFLVT
jgi:hypothetical protein